MAMSDFGTMYTRIGDELHKTATTEDARIKTAIISAINRYKYEEFWFNQDWMEFLTTAGEDDYVDGDFTLDNGSTNLPLAKILRIYEPLMYNVGTDWRRELRKVTWGEIELNKEDNTQGYPSMWASGYNRVRIWPIPNRTGDKIEGRILRDISTITTASADGTTNAWMVEAEELIRTSAMRDLYLTHYHNIEGAGRVAKLESEAFSRLKINTDRLQSYGVGIRAYY